MRTGIRARLVDRIPLIEGRVYETHESAATLDKPYVLLVQGVEAVDTEWTGFRASFECWPCTAKSEFADVDELSNMIVAALDGQVLSDPVSGRTFTCGYEGSNGPDKLDADRDVLTRGLRFSVVGVRSPAEPEETRQDPWLAALAAWTIERLGSEWQAYEGRWPVDYVRPSVLWRWEGIESVAGSRVSTIEVRRKAVGHVLGRTLGEQTAAAGEIAQRLTEAVKIPLDLPNRRYLTVNAPIVDLAQDAMTEGQLTVTLSRKIERHTDQGPLMREVRFQSKT